MRRKAGAELLHARRLTWSRGRYVENWERRGTFESVPLAVAALDPKPEARHLLIPFEGGGADQEV